jgi:hypothetical protein
VVAEEGEVAVAEDLVGAAGADLAAEVADIVAAAVGRLR